MTLRRLTSHRVAFAAAIVATMPLSLAGCGLLEPTPIMTPSASATTIIVDTTTYIGETIDPAKTVWTGRDSGGDETSFTLHQDGTVAVTYGTNAYDDPNDTWKVIDGVLHVSVFLDDTNGNAEYIGTWNPETSSIDTIVTTSVSNRNLTVTLVQQ